uniref:(northern house mosquito) hypothetical protein n=1 Tax=Culex pipiens TaxID=7175 RepID=A0A8D8AIG6_CULPI
MADGGTIRPRTVRRKLPKSVIPAVVAVVEVPRDRPLRWARAPGRRRPAVENGSARFVLMKTGPNRSSVQCVSIRVRPTVAGTVRRLPSTLPSTRITSRATLC